VESLLRKNDIKEETHEKLFSFLQWFVPKKLKIHNEVFRYSFSFCFLLRSHCKFKKKQKKKEINSILFFQIAQNSKKVLENFAHECSEEVGYDVESAMKLKDGNFSDRSAQARVKFIYLNRINVFNNDFLQCFVRCFLIKEGFVNDKDEPQIEYIINHQLEGAEIEHEKLAKIIKDCAKFEGDDHCASAYEVFEQFQEKLSETI
jgi:hypothetical protein